METGEYNIISNNEFNDTILIFFYACFSFVFRRHAGQSLGWLNTTVNAWFVVDEIP